MAGDVNEIIENALNIIVIPREAAGISRNN
jgi:hypothetical protein